MTEASEKLRRLAKAAVGSGQGQDVEDALDLRSSYATAKLRERLGLARVYVPAHPSTSPKGGTHWVHSYWRNDPRAGGDSPGPPLPQDESFWDERAEAVDKSVGEAIKAGKTTHERYGKILGYHPNGEPIILWNADRAKQQKVLATKIYHEQFDGVPSQGKAMISGGLGGAGKTTVLRTSGFDLQNYGVVNPDDVKEKLVGSGMYQPILGLTPMEESPLFHEESSTIAKMVAEMAYAEKKNIIWDMTLSSYDSGKKRVKDMQAAGYSEIGGIFVEIPIETSVQRSRARWRRGIEAYMRKENRLGGRFLPPRIVRKAREGNSTKNRKAFDQLKKNFTWWQLWNNEGAAPEKVAERT